MSIDGLFLTESRYGPVEINVKFTESNEIWFCTKLNHYQLKMSDPAYMKCWVWGDPCEEYKIETLGLGINMFEVMRKVGEICVSWIKMKNPQTFTFQTRNQKLQRVYLKTFEKLKKKLDLPYEIYMVNGVFWCYLVDNLDESS